MIHHRRGEIEWDQAAVDALRSEVGFGNEHVRQPHFLYRVYDASGVLLYIGVTMHPWGRFVQHRSTSPWWPRAHRTDWEFVGDIKSGPAAEREAIRREGPLFNKVHNRQPQAVA